MSTATIFGANQSSYRAFLNQNKEERYSRVPPLSDTRYSANGTKGKGRYVGTKRKGRCASINRDRNGDIQAAKRDTNGDTQAAKRDLMRPFTLRVTGIKNYNFIGQRIFS